MYKISIRISKPLFEALKHKSIASGKSLSDIAREYLSTGVETALNTHPVTNTSENQDIQKHLTVFTLFTHCLLEQFIKSTAPNSEQICNLAEAKAEQIALSILKRELNNIDKN